MNHNIKFAHQSAPGEWQVVLEYWEGCKCTAKEKTVVVHKKTRPLLRDVLGVKG